MANKPITIDGTRLRDSDGREVTFRGINVDAGCKLPRHPIQTSHDRDNFFDPKVSFVDRPYNEEEAHVHFARLKRWGYNVIRYIFTWEALEHEGPGIYDHDFIAHTVKILRIAKSYGFYVFMDPHQDVWSRFTGGSGSPLWTLHACGLDPEKFHSTQAAVVHNTWSDVTDFPKMLWPTNYTRLATETTFTLFFAGRDFAPNAIIDGKNIQDYLTDHYVDACVELAKGIHAAGDLEDVCVIGWETLNEPHRGLVGWEDLNVLPDDLKMRKGTMPTPWQSLLTGSGRAIEIDVYDFGSFGPHKTGTELVDPQDTSAWADPAIDDRYSWKRDLNWKLGQCLWAQVGVWEPSQDQLLLPNYFSKIPRTGEKADYDLFTNTHYMEHFRKYRDAIRGVHKDAVILMEGPVLEIPPKIKDTKDDDKRLIYASHYYDGVTLLNKHWNKFWNFDIVGFMRGKYSSPAFAVKIGETNIRNCLRDQLAYLQKEAVEMTGQHPFLFTEIGIPYDMDDSYAYRTGDFSSQVAALDANHFALEGSGANGFTLWTYAGHNNHQWGENWNGEDLSIFCEDDTVPTRTSISASSATEAAGQVATNSSTNTKSPGLRAAEAFIRPSPHLTVGDVLSYGFDLRNCIFTFTLTTERPCTDDLCTEVFLPEFHFPAEKTHVEVSGGKWAIELRDVQGESMQMLKWWHGEGEQKIKVTGVRRKLGVPPTGPNGEVEEQRSRDTSRS
ncbi:putative glycosyl hydrolase [Cyphellophora attinorum]|uniref:Putative glycosyl hydrolase n=1 Tax=Cyphellophora attinorum TaxID=1664694 RepID=A0A0N0NR24_9EURO|nr:putative glycosyl hydrolase [Phialophora attinorum]KPI44339.1 putative glycosyl hydrolase [Phialophora attinorum]